MFHEKKQREELLKTLKTRFEKNRKRHPGLERAAVLAKLEAAPEKMVSLHEMESSGGEPDVVGHDAKISSWISTPADIRKLGGALFGDHRYGQVFVYHNGAQSYYGARGFRGMLRV